MIKFSNNLKEFLIIVLPTSKGFFNWRSLLQDNVTIIKSIINRSIEDIEKLANEDYWHDDFGKWSENEKDIVLIVRERLNSAPPLLPVYGCLPMVPEDNIPIKSIHGIKIIYYGQNLEDYFKGKFGEKEQK